MDDRERPQSDRERQLEARLREAQDARLKLLAELQNRSRNSLAMIRSILRRTAARSSTLEDFAAHLEARLAAYGRAQTAVIRDPLAGADLGALLVEELLAHAMHEGKQFTVTGREVRLQPRAAELFALVFNELTLNAIKFGALRDTDGHVSVSWEMVGGSTPQLELEWRESASKAPAETHQPGFGTELIERNLAYELGATARLTHAASGTQCSISVPATDRLLVRDQGIGGASAEESAPFR